MTISNPNTTTATNATTATHQHTFPTADTKLERDQQLITSLIALSELDKATPLLTAAMAYQAAYLEEESAPYRLTPICPACLYSKIELHSLSEFFKSSPDKNYRAWGLVDNEESTSDDRWVIALV